MIKGTAKTGLAVLILAGFIDAAQAAGQSGARDWTGCYVGGQVGGVWGRSEDWIVRTPGGAFFGQSLGGHEADGWIGGVQAGCDYQLGQTVFGIRGDYGWADASGTHASALEFGVFYHSEIEALASITGRIGMLGTAPLAISKVVWPGSATIIQPQQLYLERL